LRNTCKKFLLYLIAIFAIYARNLLICSFTEKEKKDCGIRYVTKRVNMRSVQRESELEKSADNRQWTR